MKRARGSWSTTGRTSLAACAGYFARSFLDKRDLPADGLRVDLEYSDELMPCRFGQKYRRDQAVFRLGHTAQQGGEHLDSAEQMGQLPGYTETANFRRVFRRWVGISPRDYRMLRN